MYVYVISARIQPVPKICTFTWVVYWGMLGYTHTCRIQHLHQLFADICLRVQSYVAGPWEKNKSAQKNLHQMMRIYLRFYSVHNLQQLVHIFLCGFYSADRLHKIHCGSAVYPQIVERISAHAVGICANLLSPAPELSLYVMCYRFYCISDCSMEKNLPPAVYRGNVISY